MTDREIPPRAAVAVPPAGRGGAAGRQRPLRRAPGRRRPFAKLLAEEETLNHARLGGGLGYSPSRHVQVMSALMRAARSGGA
jgi:hypothetical protein